MILWLLVSQNMSEQMTFHDFCEAVSSLTEFTVIYLLFHPVKGKKKQRQNLQSQETCSVFPGGWETGGLFQITSRRLCYQRS